MLDTKTEFFKLICHFIFSFHFSSSLLNWGLFMNMSPADLFEFSFYSVGNPFSLLAMQQNSLDKTFTNVHSNRKNDSTIHICRSITWEVCVAVAC
jgi:hypothetical protein